MSYNRELIYQAKQLRKNMTAEERRLWFDYLAKCSAKFTPQKVIENYIVDFYSYEAKLVIEPDGEHHQASAKKSEKISFEIKLRAKSAIRFLDLVIMKYIITLKAFARRFNQRWITR